MATRIKHDSELPKWFKLEKYRAAKFLSSAGWYEQLLARRKLIDLLNSKNWPKLKKSGCPVFERVRATPIANITGDEILSALLSSNALHELKSSNPRYSLGIHLATVRNLYLTEGFIDREKRTHCRETFAKMFRADSHIGQYIAHPQWIDEPVDRIVEHGGSTVNVRVNLGLPDKVLVKQFKLLLKDLRGPSWKARMSSKNWRKPDYAGWIRFGVLPYLDLRLWEQETGHKIPNRVMADAIFLPSEGGEEVVRKTTAKLADELLTSECLETLAAVAANEIAERNHA